MTDYDNKNRPEEGAGGLLSPEVEGFHRSVLRTRDEPERLYSVEADLVHRTLVIREHVLLLGAGRSVKAPYDHRSVCSRSCQDVVCNCQWSVGFILLPFKVG